MNELVGRFREHVIELANGSSAFRHRAWFVKYHLELVDRIALELAALYPDADAAMVRLLVWLHDYGKIVDFDRQYEMTALAGGARLREIGFSDEAVCRALEYVEVLDAKESADLAAERVPIEVKIVSSADGCAHMVGPFFYLWWYENPDKSFEELMADNARKLAKDWERKIVLPEARRAFANRHAVLVEQAGAIPDRFFNHV